MCTLLELLELRALAVVQTQGLAGIGAIGLSAKATVDAEWLDNWTTLVKPGAANWWFF